MFNEDSGFNNIGVEIKSPIAQDIIVNVFGGDYSVLVNVYSVIK